MANKEKNTKEEPYLLNDEELDEVDVIQSKIYRLDDKRDAEEFEKEIERRPEKVDIDPKDNTATVTEDDLAEVEKTQVLKFDLKKGGDVKELQKMLDKNGLEPGKATVGTDGTLSISESLKNNNKILTTESFKKLVKNFNKINLSESEIMSILEETQNPKMTKAELLETIQNNLISEAQMNDNVRQNFESGENDYQDILGQELTNQLAQEAFQEIADDIRRKTGKQNVTLNDVQNLLGTSLMAAAKEEYRLGIENLERKAVEMIRKQYNIPANAVEFDAQIVGLPPLGS